MINLSQKPKKIGVNLRELFCKLFHDTTKEPQLAHHLIGTLSPMKNHPV